MVDGDIGIYYTIFSTLCVKIFIVKSWKKWPSQWGFPQPPYLQLKPSPHPCTPSLPFLLYFLHSTHHRQMYYLFPYLSGSLPSLSPQNCKLYESRDSRLFCSLLSPKHLEELLVQSRCSVYICWVNESVNNLISSSQYPHKIGSTGVIDSI